MIQIKTNNAPMMDDLDQIMRIMDFAFDPQWGEAWNRRQVSDSLMMPNTHYCLISPAGADLTENEVAAGFFLVRSAPDEEELLLIAVDPAYRGRGLGRKLLDRFAHDAANRGAERICLEMRDNNDALHLYRSFGFQQIGLRKDYYRSQDSSRIDAITFGMDLK